MKEKIKEEKNNNNYSLTSSFSRKRESNCATGYNSTLHKHEKILRQAQDDDNDIKKLKEQIGFNLFKIRAKIDVPLDTVAKVMKIHKSKLDKLERGHGCMNVANLEKLANFYDVNIGDLFR